MIHNIEIIEKEFLFNIKKEEFLTKAVVININICDTIEQICLN